jgi:hypothetical protein
VANKQIDGDIRPFLTQFAITRTAEAALPGRYDATLQLWVIDSPIGPTPLVSSSAGLPELATKTDVKQEGDDPGPLALLELHTKTSAVPEQDDFRTLAGVWHAHLETTTKVNAERPDFDPDCYE